MLYYLYNPIIKMQTITNIQIDRNNVGGAMEKSGSVGYNYLYVDIILG